MTQMYGKFALILALVAFLCGLAGAQAGEPIPVLLNPQNEAQRKEWQASLMAAFGDQELIWVEAEKDADLVVTSTQVMDGRIVELDVRQNALQRLSPVLAAALPGVVPEGEDVGFFALALWQMAHGNCDLVKDALERGVDPGGTNVTIQEHGFHCEIVAAYQSESTPDKAILLDLADNFAGRGQHAAVNTAWLLHQAGQPRQALALLERYIASASNRGTAVDRVFMYAKRAQFYALDFDYQAALEDLDRALEVDPENPYYHTLKGEVYLLLYEWNNAKAAFDTAIALDPEFALAYFQRGILLSTMTDIEGANADFSMYLALEPRGVYADLARQYMVEVSG